MRNNKITIYLAADSTVSDYNSTQFPQAGWGQFIGDYLTDEVIVKNHAVGGRSSKTFITEGRLAKIAEEISANDYLFIQMGHNDSTKDRPERYTEPNGSYKAYLQQYIDVAIAKNAIPVLITPVGRLRYESDEFLMDFQDYCQAMKELAEENDVFLIDLMVRSITYLTSIGYENAKELYMISVNGTDCTHFTVKGANEMARLVSEGMKESASLAKYVK